MKLNLDAIQAEFDRPTRDLELDLESWGDTPALLSDDDIALLTMPLDSPVQGPLAWELRSGSSHETPRFADSV